MYRESTVSHCSQQNVLLFAAGLTPEYRKLLILYLEPAVKMSFPKNTGYSPLSLSKDKNRFYRMTNTIIVEEIFLPPQNIVVLDFNCLI